MQKKQFRIDFPFNRFRSESKIADVIEISENIEAILFVI